ncbi:unnamed protein product [Oreochromis niloticus]|nr:unnamed protein product [Mustela putorius furo]
MASKRTKAAEKENDAPKLNMAAISSLLEQHREALASDFKPSFSLLESKFDEVRSAVEDHGQRLGSLELAADDLSRRVRELKNVCSNLSESNTKFLAKVTDLESRSRRQNLRILGLEEGVEDGRPTEFFADLLCEVFGKERLPTRPEIDRTHRIPAAKPAPGQRLCPVIIRLHRYQVKDHLILEARRGGKLEYHGRQIRMVEDYCLEVLSKQVP